MTRRSTSRIALGAATIALLSVAHGASAAPTAAGFALDRFEPAERGSDWFILDSLNYRKGANLAVGATVDSGYNIQRLTARGDAEATKLITNQTYVHVGLAYTVVERLRFAINVPIAINNRGNDKLWGGQIYKQPDAGGIGDIRLAADVRLVGQYGDAFTAAFGVRVWLPTGKQEQYTGDGSVRVAPRLSFAGDAGIFTYAGTVGLMSRKHDDLFANEPIGTEVFFGASAGLRLVDRRLLIGPEVLESTTLKDSNRVFKDGTTPLQLVFGAHWLDPSGFRIGVGAGPGYMRAPGTAEFRWVASIEYAQPADTKAAPPPPPPPADTDHDGIYDDKDACPSVAGVATNDPKTNGCPPDQDHDSILDNVDACPTVAGVKDADPKKNGCPPDHDGDGILDSVDACPDIAGIKTDDAATTGCPDKDGDTIVDKVDACVDVPGIKSADPAKNGCPGDSDGDGIPDNEDACPIVPGPKNADPKKNGCPAVQISQGQIKILEQIKFKTASAEILPVSQPIIDAVAKVMKDHPEIKKVEIQGHTDNKGSDVLNSNLSAARAESVRKALIKAGVDGTRFSAKGFGPKVPIDTNDTEEGRANNRRVEFHILVPAQTEDKP